MAIQCRAPVGEKRIDGGLDDDPHPHCVLIGRAAAWTPQFHVSPRKVSSVRNPRLSLSARVVVDVVGRIKNSITARGFASRFWAVLQPYSNQKRLVSSCCESSLAVPLIYLETKLRIEHHARDKLHHRLSYPSTEMAMAVRSIHH
jgi:hypothetical protein